MRCLCECESLAAPKHRVPGELQRRHTQHIAAKRMQSIQLPAARSPLSPPTATAHPTPPSAPPPPPHRCRNHNMYMFRANRKFRASASSSSPRMPCAFRSRILCVCVSVRACVGVCVCVSRYALVPNAGAAVMPYTQTPTRRMGCTQGANGKSLIGSPSDVASAADAVAAAAATRTTTTATTTAMRSRDARDGLSTAKRRGRVVDVVEWKWLGLRHGTTTIYIIVSVCIAHVRP